VEFSKVSKNGHVLFAEVEGINYYLDVSMMKELGTVYNGGRLDSIYSKYVPEGERTRPGGGYEDAVVIPWYDVQKLEKVSPRYCYYNNSVYPEHTRPWLS